MQNLRRSGLLLHPTSLPSPYGVGDLGPAAYRFVDFMAGAGQRLWQVLPMGPVGFADSPYLSPSTFARNTLLLSPERLHAQGLLALDDVPRVQADAQQGRTDFASAHAIKRRVITQAHERLLQGKGALPVQAFEAFCAREAAWLEPYALFAALKDEHGQQEWTRWPAPLAQRDASALRAFAESHAAHIERHKVAQFLVDEQWTSLRAYCRERGIAIMGDLALYVAHDSSDVWSNRDLYYLDDAGHPTVVGGVPPDYFSATGQRWGNPLYRWDRMHEQDYAWWIARIENLLRDVDIVRLDHFRGFEGYWEIPASEPTAVKGRWAPGPGAAFFDALRAALGDISLVAEDLGVITAEVRALIERYHLPGMAILQFAFDGDVDDRFLPHNYPRNVVAYTGTHDNDTVVGWMAGDTSTQDASSVQASRKFARAYLGITGDDPQEIADGFCRALLASAADTAIIPVQDLLALGSDARMNTPAVEANNWQWQLAEGQLSEACGVRLETWTRCYGRHAERRQPFGEEKASPHT